MKKLCLVDVSAMYFRAFFAIRPLSNSKNLPTNALYGFLSMTGKMLRDLQPDAIACCFDRKEDSFRKSLYPDYKANRSEMPEDLRPQVPYVRKLAEAMGMYCIDLESFEADDVIGMIAARAQKESYETIIVSGDKDFAQLINSSVRMFDPMKEVLYDENEVEKKWGIKAGQMIDYLALVGDSSDNIPGVRGIGPKGAVKLLQDYGSLDGIYDKLEEIKPKGIQAKLSLGRESAYLSQSLVRIVTEDQTSLSSLEDLRWQGFDWSKLQSLLDELEFRNIGDRLRKDASYMGKNESIATPVAISSSPNSSVSIPEVEIVSHETAKDLAAQLSAAHYHLFLYDGDVYWARDKKMHRISQAALKRDTTTALPPLSYSGHDLKAIWRTIGLETAKASGDSLLAEYCLLSKPIGDFNSLVQTYFPGAQITKPVHVFAYLCEIMQQQKNRLQAIGAWQEYQEVELACVPILHKMEQRGILLDIGILKTQGQELQRATELLQKKIFEHCQCEFNLDSPKQLAKVLFEDLSLPVIKKTKTGISTDSEVLQKLSRQYPWIGDIVTYREWKKLLSTYICALPELVAEDGRIHTHFNQAITATGRLSSTQPNLQNIPIRTDYGNAVRAAFVSPEGYLILSADYSQIELRVLAHITKDPGLCQAFAENKDIHTATAAEIFEVEFTAVDGEMRRRAKAVNFGIAYGMGAFSLADNLGIARTEAKDIIDRYFQRFPGVQRYMSQIVEQAKQQGYVESIFGRRRYLPELKSSNAIVRKNGERMAINSPMQASASDIVKRAMVECERLYPELRLLLQVHDELLFEVSQGEVEVWGERIRRCMEEVVQLSVPLRVNVSYGKNWQEAH